MTSADVTYKDIKWVVLWSPGQGLRESYAQDGGLAGELGRGVLLGQGHDGGGFVLGQDQGQHVSPRARAAGRWDVPEGGDLSPQLLASGPGQASEASSWLKTSAQRPAGTS